VLSHAPTRSNERPAGVTAIAALCALAGVVALGFAALAAAQVVPLSSGAFLIGGGLEQLGPLAFLLYAALMVVLAVALWKRWRWSRRVAILVAVIGIAMAVPGVSSAVMDSRLFAIAREGLQIIVRVVVVYYLSQDPVKDWFAAR
jgi:DNA-binding transcriptional regulator YbjK